MLIPSVRLWILVALGLVLALGGLVVPGLERLVLVYDLGLLVLFVVTGWLGKELDLLTVTRQTEPVLSVRQPNRVDLTVETSGADRIRVKVRDELPESVTADRNEFDVWVEPGRPTEVAYTITPFERGTSTFRGTWVRYLAPLGLCWVQRKLDTDAQIRVYPNVAAVKEFDLLMNRGHLNLIGMRKSRMKGLGQEFESLREYNDDDYRTVDWKASARRGKLVVRNFETERNQAVIVCVDLGRHMMAEVGGVTKLDHVLDASLMLMHAAERQGDQVGLMLFNDEVRRFVAPKRGRAQAAAVVDALFDARAEPVQPDYTGAFSYLTSRWKRRSLCVLFSDAENEDQAAELVQALAFVRRHHRLIVVRVSDPSLRDLRSRPVSAPRDYFARSAALWYLGDRRKAATVLTASRIDSLESEPKDLAAALVGAYLRVKRLAQV